MELKISRRYARALFELARDQNALEPIGVELAALNEALRSSPAAGEFLASAAVEDDVKRQFLEGLLQKLGSGDLLRRFVQLLASRRRATLLPTIAGQYRELAEQHLGIASAEVETARSLNPEDRERLQGALSRYTGKSVRLSEHVRPELIAGIRIQLGSLLIDGTLERQLSELNRAMLS